MHGTELREKQEEYGYRALPHPPYTVLESNWITYAQLQKLSHIAETLERFLESQRFSHTLWYLTPLMESPFAFWEGLTDYIASHDSRPLQKISQPDAFRLLLDYLLLSRPSIDPSRLREMLCADFSFHEHKNPPAFLRG